MPKVEIELDNLKDAHANGCADVKKTLERMFPDQFKKKGPVDNHHPYYFLSSIGTIERAYHNNKHDDKRFEFGNYFHTEEQAEQVLNGNDNLYIPHGTYSGNGLKWFFKAWQRHFGIID